MPPLSVFKNTTSILQSFFQKIKEEHLRSLLFGDYMEPDAEPEERVYQEVRNIDDLYPVTEQCLEEYNNISKTKMNLVIFR